MLLKYKRIGEKGQNEGVSDIYPLGIEFSIESTNFVKTRHFVPKKKKPIVFTLATELSTGTKQGTIHFDLSLFGRVFNDFNGLSRDKTISLRY